MIKLPGTLPHQTAIPGIDPATFPNLLALAGPDLGPELIRRYLADLAQVQTQLHTAFPAKDWDSLIAASHVLIGLAGTAGAHALATAARNLNAAATANTTLTPHHTPVMQGLADLTTFITQCANAAPP